MSREFRLHMRLIILSREATGMVWTSVRVMFTDCSLITDVQCNIQQTLITPSGFGSRSREALLACCGFPLSIRSRGVPCEPDHFGLRADIIGSGASGFEFHIGNHEYGHVGLHVNQAEHLIQFVPWLLRLITYLRSIEKFNRAPINVSPLSI